MELLLKEAQQEIALLRTDLFNTRRLAEERRQAVDALQSERERLAKHCEVVEGQLRSANAQLNHVPELQQRCAHLESQLRKLQSEIETAHAARRILEQELDDERRQRGAMTEQKALLEGDRARLAKQRDDLAAQLRVEQKKAREAEEEQVRAEEDAAALRSEIAALQQASAAATASSSSLAAAQSTANAAAGGPASTADTAAAIAASVAAATGPLLEQVEHERNRAAMLLSNLHAAKSEIMELSNKIADYEARHVQSVSHGPQDNEHLVQQLALAQRRGDELGERLAEATERSRQLEAEAQALREAAQAAAEAAAKAVDEAAAAKAAAVAQQQHGSSSHAGLPPLPPGGSSSSHQQQHSESSRAGGVAQHQAMAALRQSAAAEGMHHRVASSGSLYGSGQHELLMQEGAELSAEDTARLRQQVMRLKASRDKLLLEIDKQWEEIERLSGENAGMADDLRAARALAANWEKQAQDGIVQVDQLKDLLEDSARWEAATLSEHQQQHAQGQLTAPGASPGNSAIVTTAPAQQTLERLRVELLGEKARATELELQLRAVAAELLRCQHGSLDLGKSFLPMMAGVEKRLAELCRKARSGT